MYLNEHMESRKAVLLYVLAQWAFRIPKIFVFILFTCIFNPLFLFTIFSWTFLICISVLCSFSIREIQPNGIWARSCLSCPHCFVLCIQLIFLIVIDLKHILLSGGGGLKGMSQIFTLSWVKVSSRNLWYVQIRSCCFFLLVTITCCFRVFL